MAGDVSLIDIDLSIAHHAMLPAFGAVPARAAGAAAIELAVQHAL
jgi:hypothetical protein